MTGVAYFTAAVTAAADGAAGVADTVSSGSPFPNVTFHIFLLPGTPLNPPTQYRIAHAVIVYPWCSYSTVSAAATNLSELFIVVNCSMPVDYSTCTTIDNSHNIYTLWTTGGGENILLTRVLACAKQSPALVP